MVQEISAIDACTDSDISPNGHLPSCTAFSASPPPRLTMAHFYIEYKVLLTTPGRSMQIVLPQACRFHDSSTENVTYVQ